jgi:methyl-accepting chemotaxis protein
MSALYNKPIVGLIVIALVSIFLSSEFGIQLVESSAVRITVIMVVCLTIAAIYYIMLSPIQEMLARANSMSQGGDLGEAPSSGEDAGALYKSLRRMREEREKLEREIEAREERLGEFGEYLEQISKGELPDKPIELSAKKGTGAERVERGLDGLRILLDELNDRAKEMAKGATNINEVEERVLSTNRLSDVDLEPSKRTNGELARSILELNNQLRRLTIQTKVVAQDNLSSPILNERLPGELGESFGAMVESLRSLADRAQQIARGDLTMYSEGDGELSTAFNMMVSELRMVVDQITQTAVRISTSAEEIIAVLKEQELSASHQASGVEETQRTMETLLSSAKMIAESAQTVFKSAERTQANNRIISDRASELKSHTERIGEILESIKEIADRSDLLALNASLEGLRAGEAGKGFTLVANEMRRLAENIKGSVGDIKELLSDIRESALSSVMAIEEGTRLSDRTTDSALKITLITQQQQSGTEQVTQSMEELSHLINQGLAGTRQVTMAASELAGLSDDMRKIVEAFHLDENSEPMKRSRGSDWGARPGGLRSSSAHSISLMRRASDVGSGAHKQLEPRSLSTLPREDGVAPDRSGEFKVAAPSLGREKDPMRQTLQVNRPEPSGPDLHSTMRFVPGSEQEELLTMLTSQNKKSTSSRFSGDDSPTVDVSSLGDEISESRPGSDDQIDDLFDELSNTARGLKEGSEEKEDDGESSKKK